MMSLLFDSPAASIAAKATVTAALGLIGVWLARRNRAAVRHALLAASFGGLLALPVVYVVAPAIRILAPAATFNAALAPAAPILRTQAGGGAKPAALQAAGVSAADLALAGWVAGSALFMIPVLMGLWQVRSLRRSALPWRRGQAMVESLAHDAGIHRRVEALLHGALPGPITCGAAHPAIMLPEDAETWEEEDLKRAMVHELEHVRRGDWVIQCLARSVCAMYWFHPLVWIAWRQLALEAERSCDDAVLGRSEATAYADQLVALAQRLAGAGRSPLLAMANRADLATRVGAVLDSRQRRGRAGKVVVALACAAAAALVLTISPLRMIAAPQAVSTNARFSTSGMLVVEAVTVTDQSGRSIEGLNPGDFTVTEDGVPQTISVFEFQKPDAAPQPVSSYYLVGYYSANQKMDGQFRKVLITRTGDPSAQMNYRAGYYVALREGAGPGGVPNGAALDIRPPVVIHKKGPEYTDEARKAKYQGTVLLEAEISESGEVTRLKVVRALGLGLDEKAMEAVRQWKFRPGTKAGNPVAVVTEVEVNFRLL